MTDTDSYLLKCTLESIEEGISTKEIQTKCETQMGFINCNNDTNEQYNQYKNGEE